MEDKKLTPQESMEIITTMIEASKQRISADGLRISIMWAVLTIVSATAVMILSTTIHTPWINFIWYAIPIIGFPVNIAMTKKHRSQEKAKTAVDSIQKSIWNTVSMVAIILSLACIVFHLLGYPEAWITMFFFAFIVVGFGTAMQGVVLKELSYTFGGIFSIITGFVLIALTICKVPLLIAWVIPLYILCFLLMFILPAFFMHKKIAQKKQ